MKTPFDPTPFRLYGIEIDATELHELRDLETAWQDAAEAVCDALSDRATRARMMMVQAEETADPMLATNAALLSVRNADELRDLSHRVTFVREAFVHLYAAELRRIQDVADRALLAGMPAVGSC